MSTIATDRAIEAAWTELVQSVLDVYEEQPHLLNYTPRSADLEEIIEDDLSVVDDIRQARRSVLLAEALLRMSQRIHEPGDRAVISDEAVTPAEAVVLVKKHRGLRPAARVADVSYTTMWRAWRRGIATEVVAE